MNADRRRSARREPDAKDAVARLRLRTGRELNVINVGAGGALVEGDSRLLPGTHVDVHVITAEGRVLVRSRVVRAFVAGLSADRVVYRGALAFERPIDVTHGYVVPAAAAAPTSVAGSTYPTHGA